MRLRHFTVDGFAQLKHEEIAFRDDAPNVIFGLNEAGKSHLMQALLGMFFPIKDVDRLIPWDGDPLMRGVLDFVDGRNRSIRLERHLMGNDVEISEGATASWKGKVKGSTRDAEAFAADLERWLGFRDQELFTATTFVRQSDVVELSATKDRANALASHMKELITGTQETNYEAVLKQLGRQLEDIRRVPGMRKDRAIEMKKAQLAKLQGDYGAAARLHDEYTRVQLAVGRAQESLRQKRQEKDAVDDRLKSMSVLVEAESALRRLRKDFERLDQQRRLLGEHAEKLRRAGVDRAALAAFASIDEEKLAALERGVMDVQNDAARVEKGAEVDPAHLDRLETAVREAEEARAKLPPWPEGVTIEAIRGTGGGLVAAGDVRPRGVRLQPGVRWGIAGGLALVGLVLAVAVHPAFLVLVASAPVLAALPYVSGDREVEHARKESLEQLAALLSRVGVSSVDEAERRWDDWSRTSRAIERARRDLDAELRPLGATDADQARELARRYREASQKLKEQERERDDVLAALGVPAISDARRKLGELRAVDGSIARLKAAMEMVGNAEALEDEWARAGASRAAKQFEVDALLDRDPELKTLATPEARAALAGLLQRRSAQLDGEIGSLEREEDTLREQRGDLGRTAIADAPVLLNEIQELEPEIARLEMRADALQTAIDELKGAVSHFRDNCLGPVMEDTSSFLSTITAGRYTSVLIEPNNLRPTVLTPTRSVPVGALSRGVEDQLYFALRLALARAITRGRTLPLILDDPFVNFDPIRREQVLLVLRGILDRTQVILFTCDPWYAEQIEPVLTLPSPSVHVSAHAGVA